MTDAALLADLGADEPLRRLTGLERLLAAAAPLDDAAIAAVVACLATPVKKVQRGAADLLSAVGADMRPAVAARLRVALASEDPALRWGASYALGRLGLFEPAMIAPLVEVLGRRDGDLRWAAAALLQTCATVHADLVLTAVVPAAAHDDPERRKMALYVLRDVAPAHPAAYDAAMRGLADPALGVRFAALAVLARVATVPPEACARVLMLARADPDAGLRRAALCTLGVVGAGVSEVDAVLAAAAASDDPSDRRAAGLARRRRDLGIARRRRDA